MEVPGAASGKQEERGQSGGVGWRAAGLSSASGAEGLIIRGLLQ